MTNNYQIFLSNLEFIKNNNDFKDNVIYDFEEEILIKEELVIGDFCFILNLTSYKFPKPISSIKQIKESDIFEIRYNINISISNSNFVVNDLLCKSFSNENEAIEDYHNKIKLLSSLNNSDKIFEYLNNNVDFTKF